MGFVLRVIKNRPAWERNEEDTWLDANDVPADLLLSLQTTANSISVFFVEQDHVDRLVAAYGSKRDKVQTLDYVTIPAAELADQQLEIEDAPAALADIEANKWHRNVIRLTARRLTELGVRLQQRGTVVRRLDKEVGRLINASIAAGHIQADTLEESIRNDLRKAKYKIS